jgi:serine/threonine-protein kinase RsbW
MSPASTITVQAQLEQLMVLRTFLTETCQQWEIDEATTFLLTLAVDEICANIVLHGYADRAPGPITLDAQHNARQVTLTICDWGTPFDPRQAPAPAITASWEERPVGGLGIYLALSAMDEVTYCADPVQGNRLLLVKALPPRT